MPLGLSGVAQHSLSIRLLVAMATGRKHGGTPENVIMCTSLPSHMNNPQPSVSGIVSSPAEALHPTVPRGDTKLPCPLGSRARRGGQAWGGSEERPSLGWQ